MRPKVKRFHFPSISEEQAAWLERPLEEVEVKKAVWMMKGDKVLGPNGFPILFNKECWETINKDLMRVVKDFHERGILDKGSNTTFVSLIPKK